MYPWYCVYVCSVCSWDTRRAWEWGYVHGLSSFLTSLYFYVLFMNVDKWAEMIRMFILTSELQVGHSHYFWNVLSSPVTHWPLKLLTWFYFTIYRIAPNFRGIIFSWFSWLTPCSRIFGSRTLRFKVISKWMGVAFSRLKKNTACRANLSWQMSNNPLFFTVQLRDFNREWIVAIG